MYITPINTIATYNILGKVKPLYFRKEDKDHVVHTYSVFRIKDHTITNKCGMKMMTFVCDAINMDDEKDIITVKLRHHPFKWEETQI